METINPSKLDRLDDYPERMVVNDDQVDWQTEVADYQPPYFVSDHVLAQGDNADPEDMIFSAKTVSSIADEVLRDHRGRPLNPLGRTGIAGRGKLYRWGPNHAADMILTRGDDSNMEIVLGRRKDNHKLALPGGFVDANEVAPNAALRELKEETGIELRGRRPEPLLLAVGRRIVRGSTRMTDHAWIETSVYAVNGEQVGVADVEPIGGDDLEWAGWVDLRKLNLVELHDDHADYIRHFLRLAEFVELQAIVA